MVWKGDGRPVGLAFMQVTGRDPSVYVTFVGCLPTFSQGREGTLF